MITGSPTKVYDGTKSATLTGGDYELDGFVGTGQGDQVPQSATANYVTKDVGNGLGVASTLVTSDFLANARHQPRQLHPADHRRGQQRHHPAQGIIDLTGTPRL